MPVWQMLAPPALAISTSIELNVSMLKQLAYTRAIASTPAIQPGYLAVCGTLHRDTSWHDEIFSQFVAKFPVL